MQRNLRGAIPLLIVLIFVIGGCRCGKTDPPAKPLDAQKINPYRGAIEELLAPKIYYEDNLDWWLHAKRKIEISGATEALKVQYYDIKGNFDSTAPYEIEIVVVNFPSAEAAREHFQQTALGGAKEDSISKAVMVGEREIGRAVTKGSRVFWTSGSIYCETNPRFLPDGFIQKMLAR